MQSLSGSMARYWPSYVVAIACTLVLTPVAVDSIAVMSIDLGTEWMKVAIVSPGVPMEIALNKESKRKTPVSIVFRDDERLFGEDAASIGVRFPKLAYHYLLDLIGKPVNHPIVKLFQQRFPYYKIVEDPVRGTVVFEHDNNTVFYPEELLAMFFEKAKEMAQNSANQVINEAVITVPGYFNQAERRAVLQAAELAKLKVLQLINDYTAVALNYGIFRNKDFNESAQYVMFYDMGASSTTATIISYQLVNIKDKFGRVETHPQLQVIGVGYDRTLGGLEMQIRLRNFLATEFAKTKVTSTNIFEDPRAMAKLFKEAGRVKNVLSANTEHYAQVEGLLDEKDFKRLVTREEFENICAELKERVAVPVKQALKMSNLGMDVIKNVILVGAGTRVPFVQSILKNEVQMELSKNLNTDEAAVLGAVYKAADLSTGFKVKKFITKDGVIFPIQVVFERDNDGVVKQVKRILFNVMNPYPLKKVLTFNKHQTDFSFSVNYAELDHIIPTEVLNIGDLKLMQVNLKGVEESLAKHKDGNLESKGIKAHFNLDDNGILTLSNVELVLETLADTVDENEEESSFFKLGNTISKLFRPPEEALKESGEQPQKDGQSVESKDEADGKKSNITGDGKDEAKNNETAKSGEKKKPKIISIKEPITAEDVVLGVVPIKDSVFQEITNKMDILNKHDEAKKKREVALNSLEAFVFDAKNKIEEEPYSLSANVKEKEGILNLCSEIMNWLDDEGMDADTATYEKKLSNLKQLTQPVWRRVKEHEERPDALDALEMKLNASPQFITKMKQMAVNPKVIEEQLFAPNDIEQFEKAINETKNWKQKMVALQASLKLNDNPKLTVKDIRDKINFLDREIKYLLNKVKLWSLKEERKDDKPNANNTSKKEPSDDKNEKENDKIKVDEVPDEPKETNQNDEFAKKIKEELDSKFSDEKISEEKLKSKSKSKEPSKDEVKEEEIPALPEPSKTDKEEIVHTEL